MNDRRFLFLVASTREPGHVGKTESHGCVRMTNWDALRVADAVDTSVPVVMQE